MSSPVPFLIDRQLGIDIPQFGYVPPPSTSNPLPVKKDDSQQILLLAAVAVGLWFLWKRM